MFQHSTEYGTVELEEPHRINLFTISYGKLCLNIKRKTCLQEAKGLDDFLKVALWSTFQSNRRHNKLGQSTSQSHLTDSAQKWVLNIAKVQETVYNLSQKQVRQTQTTITHTSKQVRSACFLPSGTPYKDGKNTMKFLRIRSRAVQYLQNIPQLRNEEQVANGRASKNG